MSTRSDTTRPYRLLTAASVIGAFLLGAWVGPAVTRGRDREEALCTEYLDKAKSECASHGIKEFNCAPDEKGKFNFTCKD
jgi:hypothetical protein